RRPGTRSGTPSGSTRSTGTRGRGRPSASRGTSEHGCGEACAMGPARGSVEAEASGAADGDRPVQAEAVRSGHLPCLPPARDGGAAALVLVVLTRGAEGLSGGAAAERGRPVLQAREIARDEIEGAVELELEHGALLHLLQARARGRTAVGERGLERIERRLDR